MLGKLNYYATKVSIFLITAALIAGMGGSHHVGGGDTLLLSQNLKIRTWYDLNNVRDNLGGNHTLMNDLDSTTPGYEELASPTANEGKGWQPIGFVQVIYFDSPCGGGGMIEDWYGLNGTFDGQGYEIRDLFINRPGEDYVGLFGVVDEGGIIKNIGAVNVTVIGDYYVGGLVGGNRGTVSNSHSSGNVTGGEWGVGGLVGTIESSRGAVSNSYSTCNVIGNGAIGGLVGWNGFTISNSYSTGDVTGSYDVGGLVGKNNGTVSNSYSTGSVTGNPSVGGLVGRNEAIVNNCFWDLETSGQSTSDGGTGKTTAEMQDIATFSGAGWDIIAVALNQTNSAYIWNIINGVTYPFLSWQS